MDFPIPKQTKLPVRISPCPILEAVMEIRFVANEEWAFIPGMLMPLIKDKYPKSEKLPLSNIPEEHLRLNPGLVYSPRIRFIGPDFVIQLGPRVISLLSTGDYPGWTRIFQELTWLLERLKRAGFIHEGERLGLRYIDFFEEDIFSHLVLDIQSNGQAVEGVEMNFSTVFRRDDLTARLSLANGAIAKKGNKAVTGSVLDLDVWLDASEFDVFVDAAEHFEEAHRCNKEIFFGLLRKDFLASLEPEYE